MPQKSLRNRTVAGLYRAAIEPAQWTAALEDLIALLGGVAARFALDGPSGRHSGPRVHIAGIYTEDARRTYLEDYQALDPRPALLAALPPGTIVASHQHLDGDHIRHSEFFNEFLVPQGAGQFLSCDLRAGRLHADFCISRSAAQKPFDTEDIALFGELVPHLQNAARLYDLASRLPQHQGFVLAALDGVSQAIVMANEAGRVVYVNAAAARLLARQDGLAITRDGLATARPADDARLAELIQRACREGDDFAGGVVRVARPSGRHPYSISVTSLVAETALEGDLRGTAALVAIGDPDDDFDQLGDRFAALFGLTKAETKLVAALMTGKQLSEIASESGLRMPTLRAQLSAVFRKTETSRQADLIRVAKSIPR